MPKKFPPKQPEKWVTDYKAWDKKANGDYGYIGPGNVNSDVQFGWLIRSWWDKGEGCGDFPKHVRAPGELFRFDIRPFKPEIPWHIELKVRRVSKRPEHPKGVWLHRIAHRNADHIRMIHGYVLTDHDHYLLQWWINHSNVERKSLSVMETVLPYLAIPTKKYDSWHCSHCGAYSPKAYHVCRNCQKEED